jgi:hypothetical protein
MNFTLLSEILGFVVQLLGTLRGDPTHAKLANALTAVHEVASAVAAGSDINPQPVHAVMEQIVSTGRAPTPEELARLGAVAKAAISGEVVPAPLAQAPESRAPRRSIQPGG